MIEGIKACVFDAYGTLLDLASAVARCADIPEAKRAALVALWRDKQLQYAWLHTLQRRHPDFAAVTADALDFALEATSLTNPERRRALLELYQTLSVYPEVPATLAQLKSRGLITAILSNGTPAMLKAAIDHGTIATLLDQVLSVESVGIFKPAPEAYQLAMDRLGVAREEICFISSNGWDAYGGAAFGFQVVWCNRAEQPAERLPGTPKAVVRNLDALPALIVG